jgi:dTMP kinase
VRRGRTKRGAFITLEGIEGSGKSTQALRLCRALSAHGYRPLRTREPGGTLIAERLRAILLDHSTETIAPETEALVILAARCQHVAQVIRPALRQGKIVICDRFVDSTLAYQGYARGLDRKVLRAIHEWATEGLSPDLTVLFNVPVAVGLSRRYRGAGTGNRLDHETERFHRRVRSGFLQLARREPRRIKLVDAAQTPASVAAVVERLVMNWLRTHRIPKRPRS